MITRKLPVARIQALQRASDLLVHHFMAHSEAEGGRYDGRDFERVRVCVQRILGWSFPKIEKIYGIPLRTAKRWESTREGMTLLRQAAQDGEIDRAALVKVLTGQSET